MNNSVMDVSGVDPINVTYWFPQEKSFDIREFDNYMKQHWTDCFVYSTVYIIVIFSLKVYMSNREAFDLRPYLSAWSGALAIFSILGTVRTLPEFFWGLSQHDFEYILCSNAYLDRGTVSSFWHVLFLLSKVGELGDTLFIVLRKQRLIFLHWYHHTTVLMYCWYSYTDKVANARMFVIMNFAVHSAMYTYYAFRAMKFRFPKWVSMSITLFQLAQMILGLVVILSTYVAYSSGRKCITNYQNITWALLMYFSYFILFAHFFNKAYIVKASPNAHEKKH